MENLPAIGTTVYASLSTADSWDFEVRNVTDPATTEVVSGLPTRAFALTMASAPSFQLNNQEYEVRVRTVQEESLNLGVIGVPCLHQQLLQN